MRYYGNKTKLLPFIEKVVKKTGINVNSTFVDLFSGTSAVGKNFKRLGYRVYSNLLSPKGMGTTLTKLLKTFNRKDILEFRHKRKISILKWDESKQGIDFMNSIL